MKKIILCMLAVFLLYPAIFAGGSNENAARNVTIEFMQWWEPEMKQGDMAKIIAGFEAANPGIKVKLVSKPYAEVQSQVTIGSAAGTLSDVIGIDGAWTSNLVKQNAIVPYDTFIKAENYDVGQIAGIAKIKNMAYTFAVATFIYPMYYNETMFSEAGITNPPKTREEFLAAARKLTVKSKNQFGWTLPLSLQNPNGIQNDVLSWAWASGSSAVPKVNIPEVAEVMEFINTMYKEGLITPGAFAKMEQEKVEEFVNGRTAMMISSLAHINMIRERNPSLKFNIFGFPVKSGYTGKSSMPYAAWNIGISKTSKNQEAAWKLVKYLMSPEVNGQIADSVNAFPGNNKAQPAWVTKDVMFAKAFQIFQQSNLRNEFDGAPEAENLMRIFDTEFQKYLDGKQSTTQALTTIQTEWDKVYAK